MCKLGWKSLGVLELTALPSIDEERWVPLVQETDVLLASGGDALYLCHWMRQSGLADLLPSLDETVWVGLSAGSMVMTPRIGDDFVGWKPPTGGDETLGIVDFSIFPHLDNEDLPWNTMANAERWAGGLSGPAYAINDETAIKVADGDRRRRIRGALETAHHALGLRPARVCLRPTTDQTKNSKSQAKCLRLPPAPPMPAFPASAENAWIETRPVRSHHGSRSEPDFERKLGAAPS